MVPKDFIKYDIIITVLYILYYFTANGVFDEYYSTGYVSVSRFFLFMNFIGISL
jgi:hypothetical protein